jgi:proteasome lid subunit RPN8/RPN11
MDLSTAQRSAILHAVWAALPNEACGVIAGGGRVIQVRNIADDPVHYFDMNPTDLMNVFEQWGDIEAIWHSHPRGSLRPSTTDRAGRVIGVPYFIANCYDVAEVDFGDA